MFKDNTVFVIGAGASQEFGLPVGAGLMQTIKQNCSFVLGYGGRLQAGPAPIFQYYERIFGREDPAKVNEFNQRLNASWQIKDGIESADSIDEYIFRYSDNPIIAEVGKLQIAYAISVAEMNSILSFEKGFRENLDVADNTWIWAFAKALINGYRASEVEKIGHNITIITFNYDRCIEHYLEHALPRSFYGMTIEEARGIVKNIKIVHPYGKLGELDKVPFGEVGRFVQAADNLITWSETVREPDIIEDMRATIRTARRIVFMGFAFARQNLELLDSKPTAMNADGPRVYSTGFGLRRETEESLCRNINALYSDGVSRDALKNIHFQYEAKCNEFFNIHRLNLVQ
ncbi:hypothetical protein AU381_27145 [Sinorhizobium glycinis]|uniref:SIR2-like domain-containing protein n=1 Tax=Sinorhizobium glycinis TaxID=1472378 RepID=A0A178Y984_9HYPH|nr:hypothetical protein [Sinorhizobium glycinis]OAP43275.1 hypothetical protein AU381_27145 [Sinorhizobium glycinis]